MLLEERSRPESPNFYAYSRRGASVSVENAKRFGNPPADVMVFSRRYAACQSREHSSDGCDRGGSGRVNAAYLDDSNDLKTLIRGLGTARAIGNAPALAPFRRREVLPGSLSGLDLEEFFRNGLTTYWHQSCSAKMGRDEMSVVDSKLKVYGVDGLRIADASVLPRVDLRQYDGAVCGDWRTRGYASGRNVTGSPWQF